MRMLSLFSVALMSITCYKSLYISRITAYLNVQASLPVSRLFSGDSIDVS